MDCHGVLHAPFSGRLNGERRCWVWQRTKALLPVAVRGISPAVTSRTNRIT